ncbi:MULTISPECIES: hypothetical protein [Bacteria]|uniref:hypothetical protein n=1 Tax=Bacteria TaxID=2 RepID=UPI002E7BD54F|nr:hypothetical protein [Cetobacterium somerae]WVJ03102.1 hypothetical protein VSU16_14355 [Cetobacterium somerae]
MKIKINLSFLQMISKIEKSKLKSERLTNVEWKILILGIGILRNKLYKNIGIEKNEDKILDFLKNKMSTSDREIEITSKHRQKYFNKIRPSLLYDRISRLTRSEVLLTNTVTKKESANIITDRACNEKSTFFNFEYKFIKELYCGKSGYSLVTDNIFKLKKSHSIPLAILMSRFNKKLIKSTKEWNELFSVKLINKDLIKFMNDAINDVNANMEFDLKLVKLDSNKKVVTGNKKFEYIEIIRENKVEIILPDDLEEKVKNIKFEKNSDINLFKKDLFEAASVEEDFIINMNLDEIIEDGYNVKSYKEMVEMLDKENNERIPEYLYEVCINEMKEDDFKRQLEAFKLRRPNVYNMLYSEFKGEDIVDKLKEKILNNDIKLKLIY